MESHKNACWIALFCFVIGCPGGLDDEIDGGGQTPDESGADAGELDGDDAGSGQNSGQDAGQQPLDAGQSVDAGQDAGMAIGNDGGTTDDAGNPEACTSNICEEITIIGSPLVLNGNANPWFEYNGDTISVGTSRRSDVESALGSGTPFGENEFRIIYCTLGIRIEYVAADQTGNISENTSSNDKVARIVTLSNSNAQTDDGSTIGDLRSEVIANQSGASYESYQRGAYTFDFYGSSGLQYVFRDDSLVSIALFRPQSVDGWGLGMDLMEAQILSADGQDVLLETGSSDFNDVSDVLGSGFDSEGVFEIQQGIATIRVWIRVYAAFGLRFAGICSLFGSCDEDAELSSIVVSSPFMGVDANGLGLGSSREEVEASVGEGNEEEPSFYVYSGQNDLGVYYSEDLECEEAASSFLLDYVSN